MSVSNNAKLEKELLAQKLRTQALLHLQKEGQAVEKIPLTGVMIPKKDVGKGGDNTLDIILKQKAKALNDIKAKSFASVDKSIPPQQQSASKETAPLITVSSLPSCWQEVPDGSTGRSYYWNTQTNVTTWERPELPSGSTVPAPALPEGWVEKTHPATRQKYYSHTATGRTSVTLPVAPSASATTSTATPVEQGKRPRDGEGSAGPQSKR